MYIAIVFSGGILGGLYGVFTAIIAGILVGPLMPYDLVTGETQIFADWFFRLLMMIIVGLMSGYFSKNYRYVNEKIKTLMTVNSESTLYNINYLKEIPFDLESNYIIMSMIISNHQTICDIAGYKTYYDYLKTIESQLLKYDVKSVVIHPQLNKIWVILPCIRYEEQIEQISKLIKNIKQVDNYKFFVDFGLGFHQIRIEQNLEISSVFSHTDVAANEALEKHILYRKFKNIETHKRYEYELLSEFEESLKNDQIFMVYQPKIDLKTRKPVGLEALVRWYHPIKKMIYPDDFIPAVEQTSLVHMMTEEIFRKVLTFHQNLKQKGIEVPISINVSAKNLYDMSFYKNMIDIFRTFDISPHMVKLEITETVLMEKPELSKSILEKFSKFGFKIVIDDFGKGYSSLAYLAQFPIHTIKIDKYFTSQILISQTTQAIVKATIALALQLGYEVLIEGIEDKETADLLETYGCHTAQGYYFMKPEKELTITNYMLSNFK
jgi:EAL domain-containing protein (putative c-di-GMP-specific phosphodiesterase class I)